MEMFQGKELNKLRIICLSATLKNIEEFRKWLKIPENNKFVFND